MGNIGVTKWLSRDYIGIMEKKMETTIYGSGSGFRAIVPVQ